MPGKRIALVGGVIILGGIAVFLLGAFVLTNDARHHDVSPAVAAGLLLLAAGAVLLAAAGMGALYRRLRRKRTDL
jgi:drug/metabolite transporter (DMT)-like permease